MAFATTTLYLAEFRTAADDFKYLHLLQMNGCTSQQHAYSEFFKHTNADAKLEKLTPIQTAKDTGDRLAKLMEESKGDYRALVGNEHRMTKADVEAASKMPSPLSVPAITIPPNV